MWMNKTTVMMMVKIDKEDQNKEDEDEEDYDGGWWATSNDQRDLVTTRDVCRVVLGSGANALGPTAVCARATHAPPTTVHASATRTTSHISRSGVHLHVTDGSVRCDTHTDR